MAGNHDKDESEILKPTPSSPPPLNSSPTPPPPLLPKPSQDLQIPRPERAETSHAPPKSPATAAAARFSKRCWSCRKRVGLTGFRCRCGELFCASHRHWDTHDCSFDYKAFGKEEISKANPLIRPAKIIKI